MRTMIIALLMTLATQLEATDKKYGNKEFIDISDVIDLFYTSNRERFRKNPVDKKQALEI